MRVNFFLAAVAMTALCGCVSSAKTQELRESPGFAAGYGDGCVTANEADKSFSTKEVSDASAFENDEGYRYGWRQGFLECSPQGPQPKTGGRILGERNEY